MRKAFPVGEDFEKEFGYEADTLPAPPISKTEEGLVREVVYLQQEVDKLHRVLLQLTRAFGGIVKSIGADPEQFDAYQEAIDAL